MDDASKVRSYFTKSAVPFDSLYGEEEMNPFWRWVNRRFRRDIYERYLLAVDHARAIGATSALDVGCGSGRYAVGLAEAGVRRIVGVDFSPSMIELAERHTGDLPGVGVDVDFTCADFMAWETDERFDLVIAMGFFDYMADPVAVLRKMRGLANRSVLASFPSVSVYRTPIRKVRYRVKRVPVHFYRPGQIEAYADEAGFSGVRLHKVPGAGQDNVAAFSV